MRWTFKPQPDSLQAEALQESLQIALKNEQQSIEPAHLLLGLIRVDPSQRISLEELLQHSFFKNELWL